MNGSGCKTCPVKPCHTLHYRGSYCAEQRAKFGLGDPQTISDRIRSMTDEQMAEKIYDLYCKLADGTINDISVLYCDGKAGCIDKHGQITCTDEMHKACILRRLQSPAKEDTNNGS